MNSSDVPFFFLVALVLSTLLVSETGSKDGVNHHRSQRIQPLGLDGGRQLVDMDDWIKKFDFQAEDRLRRSQLNRNKARASDREAWVLLLDGDDPVGHYGTAAYAHVRALLAHGGGRPVVVLVHGGKAGTKTTERLAAVGALIHTVSDLAPLNQRARLIKHVNKVHLWSLIQYDKVVFIDLDMALLRPWILADLLFQYPGSPPTFNLNYERDDRFNSGLMVIKPSMNEFNRITKNILPTYESGWDSTDQSLVHAAFDEFGRVPAFLCPKKRLRYTDPALWAHLTGVETDIAPAVAVKAANGSVAITARVVAPQLACIHWTGEKPWKFQKRDDLDALTILWHKYMAYWGEQSSVPQGDYSSKKFNKMLKKRKKRLGGKKN